MMIIRGSIVTMVTRVKEKPVNVSIRVSVQQDQVVNMIIDAQYRIVENSDTALTSAGKGINLQMKVEVRIVVPEPTQATQA